MESSKKKIMKVNEPDQSLVNRLPRNIIQSTCLLQNPYVRDGRQVVIKGKSVCL